MPKIRNAIASHPIGLDSLSPVYTGPGLNFFWPQTRRQKIGVPQATLFAATAREKSADAAAGAMRQRRPRTQATKTHPHTARTGMKRVGETLRKNLLKGSAPSRENAYRLLELLAALVSQLTQLCRLTATRILSPMRNWTMNRRDMNPNAPFFPSES